MTQHLIFHRRCVNYCINGLQDQFCITVQESRLFVDVRAIKIFITTTLSGAAITLMIANFGVPFVNKPSLGKRNVLKVACDLEVIF